MSFDQILLKNKSWFLQEAHVCSSWVIGGLLKGLASTQIELDLRSNLNMSHGSALYSSLSTP